VTGLGRREFVGAAAVSLLAGCTGRLEGPGAMEETYGLIGQIMAAPGKRAELIGYLIEGTREMPGNLAYIVAEDLENPDAVWITEVWRTKTDHGNSLSLPGVQAAIAKARPIMAGFGTRAETRPVGFAG
jgi:quinol monooxygenase YgiN